MLLYDYFRSSACYRVRIALHLKGVPFEKHEVHLVKEGGEQFKPTYTALNPQARVPTLLTEQGAVLTQSLAILEYLEECYPNPAILPASSIARAQVRALANIIVCDIHPLNNLSVLQYLQHQLQVSEANKQQWYAHWVQLGFQAIETHLANTAGMYCVGETITLADICLVPQVYNAMRFAIDLSPYPRIQAIYARCLELAAFQAAAPEKGSLLTNK